MTKILFYLFFVLTIFGCSSIGKYVESAEIPKTTKEVPVFITGFIETNEVLGVMNGLDEWNYALNNNIKYKFIGGFPITDLKSKIQELNKSGLIIVIVPFEVLETMIINKKLPPNETIALTKKFGNVIYIVKEKLKNNKQISKEVVVHEIGHTLGMEHLDFNSMMNKKYENKKYNCIDKAMVLSVAFLNDFNWKTMRYCITEELY